ncbi:hypothetical protein EVAR_39302_1 [Eumeta japonica]|uniref:Uncharacterized protein n=1 Tax=Eumeta variegata TaxID=151549 RepID=A0A4C1VZ84_EUMVA|nr:hypothetical protein EVAR_39302_1 [Eumeta japonica]
MRPLIAPPPPIGRRRCPPCGIRCLPSLPRSSQFEVEDARSEANGELNECGSVLMNVNSYPYIEKLVGRRTCLVSGLACWTRPAAAGRQ